MARFVDDLEPLAEFKARSEKRNALYRLELELLRKRPELRTGDFAEMKREMVRAWRRCCNVYPIHAS